MGKIVLCMQYWEGDREQALRTSRFIADLQDGHSDRFDFMFCPRFDSSLDPETIRYVSRKFNVWTHVSTRREVGWPAGCNGIVSDLFMESLKRYRNGTWKNVKAVWLLESDVTPLKKNWLDLIDKEWDQANALVMGAWQPEWSPVGHINGNMLFVPNLAEKIRGLEGCPPHMPWDTFHAQKFSRHWHKSPQMVNFYKRTNVTPNEIYPEGNPFCFVHGIKDSSGIDIARQKIFVEKSV